MKIALFSTLASTVITLFTFSAWSIISKNGSSLDAVEQGCSVCEVERCDGTVGYGGRYA